MKKWGRAAALVLLLAGASAAQTPLLAADGPDAEALKPRIAALEERKTRLHDLREIERLQHAFGYYIDKGLWDEAADLFAENGTIEIALDGIYVGKERVRQYLHALGGGENGLPHGRLNTHLQIMPVITLSEDGQTAEGRWRALILAGDYGERALWGEGPYENDYVKKDGVWKIKTLHWFQSIMVPYEGGWAKNKDVNGGIYVSDELSPDLPPTFEYATWPETFLPQFHFGNPVAGAAPVADHGEGGKP